MPSTVDVTPHAFQGETHVNMNNDPVYVRRRGIALGAAAVVVLLVAALLVAQLWGGGDDDSSGSSGSATSAASSSSDSDKDKKDKDAKGDEDDKDEPTQPSKVESSAPEESPAKKQGKKAKPADSDPVQVQRLSGDMSPKSVVASVKGQVFAQNMMYTHTMSVFTGDGSLQKTIDDSVDLSDFGVKGHEGKTKGAPVEMAFSPDGDTAWVSNYNMYGDGFLPEGKDACVDESGISNSYLYKVDTKSLKITDVVEVGAVPKYVAVTHDGSKVLVTNWCSMDMSVVDAKTGKVTDTIEVGGKHPRGIAVSPDDKTAYVALMGDNRTVKVDLESGKVEDFANTGGGPRHLLMSPDGSKVYVSNNGEGTVSEVDAKSGEVTREVTVGSQPRSMAISPDGGAIYVGNYDSSTMSKIRTKDFEVTHTEQVDALPIGITYEPTKQRVWVASYGGTIVVFDDSKTADE